MLKMGLRQANQNFSELVRALRQGKRVVLTDRGKPLAVVEPIAQQGGALSAEEAEEAALDRMEAEGLIAQRGRSGPMPSRDWKPLPMRGKSAAQMVIEERQERG